MGIMQTRSAKFQRTRVESPYPDFMNNCRLLLTGISFIYPADELLLVCLRWSVGQKMLRT